MLDARDLEFSLACRSQQAVDSSSFFFGETVRENCCHQSVAIGEGQRPGIGSRSEDFGDSTGEKLEGRKHGFGGVVFYNSTIPYFLGVNSDLRLGEW